MFEEARLAAEDRLALLCDAAERLTGAEDLLTFADERLLPEDDERLVL